MLTLQNPSQLNSITTYEILNLIKLRLTQLEEDLHSHIIIVESGDTIEDIEKRRQAVAPS